MNEYFKQSVVAAQSEPDTIEVNYQPWLDGEDKFSVGKCSVGSKRTKVVMAEEGDTVEEDVDAEQTSALCISNDIALRLARLGIELEERFGGPRDIEFAVVKVIRVWGHLRNAEMQNGPGLDESHTLPLSGGNGHKFTQPTALLHYMFHTLSQ